MTKTQVFSTVDSLRDYLNNRSSESTVGFVPTMGALHHGHLTLVRASMERSDITVVSIFVNPTQFNNPNDLTSYPRNLERDTELLETVGDVVVFAPTEKEVYPDDYIPLQLNIGALGTVMEGAFRPGHFEGVVNVVKRLFDIVNPDYAFFGLKDFQQLAVIQFMVNSLELPTEIVPVAIVRESSGLASSSRNARLSPAQLIDAAVIYEALQEAKETAAIQSPDHVRERMDRFFASKDIHLELEYFEIVHPETLQPLRDWMPGAHACIAAYSGDVRLIDNLRIKEL